MVEHGPGSCQNLLPAAGVVPAEGRSLAHFCMWLTNAPVCVCVMSHGSEGGREEGKRLVMQHERDGWVWPPVGTRFVLVARASTTQKKRKKMQHMDAGCCCGSPCLHGCSRSSSSSSRSTRAEFSQHKWAFSKHKSCRCEVGASVEFARFYHRVAANVAQFWATNL